MPKVLLISLTVTPASLSSRSSSVPVISFFLEPNSVPVPNSSDVLEEVEVAFGLSEQDVAVGAVVVVMVVSDLDRFPLKKVFNPDFLGVATSVAIVEEDEVDIVVMESETAVGVVAIEAFPEDKELYVPDFDEAAAVALAMISAIIS